MKNIFTLIRPKQYIKNLLVFFPLFFSLKLFDTNLLVKASIAFAAFCFAASSVYIINDIRDVEKDRAHPKKKKRPMATGAVSMNTGIVLATVLISISFAISYFAGFNLVIIVAAYFAMNIFYSFGLKNIPLLDIHIISAGFIMRLLAGTDYGAVKGVLPSHWIIIMTFLLSLFLAFAKRRDDIILASKGVDVRKSIEGYSIDFVNGAMSVMSAVIIVSYLLYTLDTTVMNHFKSNSLYVTSFFVVLGIFRYMQLTFVYNKTGNPTEVVFTDRFLQVTILCWIGLFLYFGYQGVF
jgi:decaprenyl-phosphate phosphoribosyltransferase